MGKIAMTYNYVDEHDTLLYQTVRLEPKDFRQRRPDGKDWAWNLEGVRRVLYRLPEILALPQHPVIVVEGEKDADALAALGLVATTNVCGSGKWQPEYSEVLRGRRVTIIPDADPPGWLHAGQVAGSLLLVGVESLRVFTLPDGCKDVSDWLSVAYDESGGEIAPVRQKLVAMIRAARQMVLDADHQMPT